MRDGWILEISIDYQGGTEVGLLTIHPMISHILVISGSHGFLRNVEIMQEISSGGRGVVCHGPCKLG